MANPLAFKLQISDRLPDAEKVRQCAQIISANTNIGNGSKMEFTHKPTAARRTAKKTLRPNRADLNGNTEETEGEEEEEENEDADSCLNLRLSTASQLVVWLRQAGRLHAGE